MASQNDIRERVTNEIIEALQRGISPWHMPWSPATNTGFPANVVSKRPYSGVNVLLLHLAALEQGFQSRWWGTFEHWSSQGGHVRSRPAFVSPGCWGTRIVLGKHITRLGRDRNGERHTAILPLLRERTVFNADQVDNVPHFQVQALTVDVQPNYQPAEKVIAATGADIREVEADKAWYFYPPPDRIEIPPKFNFILGKSGLCGWYDSVFHELCHWTEPRLCWDGGYALNEMRAEIGAGFLSSQIGIPSYGPGKHHFNHVESWVGALRQDHRAIFRVSSAASAAAAFILACSRAEKPEKETAAVS